MKKKDNLPDEEIQRLLKQVIDHFQKEDESVRQRQIRTWRNLKIMWEGFRNNYYDEVAHDWRIPADSEGTDDQAYYDKPINVFRAYLESIIAALSVVVPPIKCFPEDADDNLDLLTARAGDQIAKKVYFHNDVSLVWIHSLFVYMTEGLVACYNYPDSKKEYGQYEENYYNETPEEHELLTCPECGYEIEDNIVEPDSPTGIIEEQEICPQCGSLMVPQVNRNTIFITQLLRKEFKNKTRQRIETYGGTFVRTPTYARKQEDCLYINYDYETHYANVIAQYEHLREKFCGRPEGVYDPYEAWGRLSPQYLGEYPENNITCRNWWLRSAAFNVLSEEDYEILIDKYPTGIKVVLANDEFAEVVFEELDDRWTLTYNPLSDYLQHDPIGLLLVSVQEITNDLVSLTIQTIEHGIGQTFVDPRVLDLQAYRNQETVPGGIYATKTSNKPLNESFFEIKTATLSQEVLPFSQQVQQMGQLVSGALPSLFGGALEDQKTASGYAMSRAQALQRLQNTWKVFTSWWVKIFEKVIPLYIESIKEDEKDVQLTPNGGFINVFIRKADLEGKIGKIQLEANENLPITWSQRKDMIFQLLQSGNPQILAYLGAPENLVILREALGLDDFYIPGEDDRNKQYEEIKLLLNSEPIIIPPSIDPMMGQMNPEMMQDPIAMQAMQPQEIPSVEIDPDIDNHEMEFTICRGWLVSDAGRLAKTENPEGYKNVLLHAKQHLQMIQQSLMAEQMAAQSEEGGNDSKPKESDKPAPIMENEDVPTT